MMGSSPARGLVQFILAFSFVLLLLFAFFELGLLAESWLSVQNSARVGLEYAVSGQYNPAHCGEAAGILDGPYAEADLADGSIDCLIPPSYTIQVGTSSPDLTPALMQNNLLNQARYLSILEKAQAGAVAINRNSDLVKLTDAGQPGYFQITICPDPNPEPGQTGDEFDFVEGTVKDNVRSHCVPSGSAGDLEHPYITVDVEYDHPLLNPVFPSGRLVVRLASHQHGVLQNLIQGSVLTREFN